MLIRWTSLPLSVEGERGVDAGLLVGGWGAEVNGEAEVARWASDKAGEIEASKGPPSLEFVWKLRCCGGGSIGLASVVCGTGRPTIGLKKFGGSPTGMVQGRVQERTR